MINVSIIAINFFIIAITLFGSNYLLLLEGIATCPMGVLVSIRPTLELELGCQVSSLTPSPFGTRKSSAEATRRPVLMLVLELIFLLLQLLCFSEQDPVGPCLKLSAADHCTMILRDTTNIRSARDDCIRAM